MSRPRKPYGPDAPGRLPATMIKVLAAEMSDHGRLSRGKRYWAENAVVDIVVGHGAVTAEILGSRAEPYIVTLEASGGGGVPSKRDLWVHCTCPDDTGTGADACKHAVAALFALSDEVAIEPDLVDRWRSGARTGRQRPVDEALGPNVIDPTRAPRARTGDGQPSIRPDEQHTAGLAAVVELRPRSDPELDAIAVLLRTPAGAVPPTFPQPDPIAHRGIRDRLLADTLDDALDHLAIRWD